MMKYVSSLLLCGLLALSLAADEPAPASTVIIDPAPKSERIDIEMPMLVNAPGSGRYGSFRPDHHIPFGIHWTEAKPADYIWLLPSMLGGTAFVAVGNIIGWPFKAGWNAWHGEFGGESMVPPLDWSMKYFGVTGAYIVGAPFWGLKKAFVDFPIWLFGGGETKHEADDYEDYDY